MRIPLQISKFLPLLLAVVLLGAMISWSVYADTSSTSTYPEISEIRSHSDTFNQLREYFSKIADEKGALYAFEILREAPLPPQTDVHLLGHVIGDKLYKEYGKDAISFCTDEFRNACSHTVVVGLLLEYGSSALDDISEACKKAPGGIGAYTMCFHGLGHGVLAYVQYDLQKTVELCRKTGTAEHRYEEFSQCVGGAIMESISGGGHDRAAWEAARPMYLNSVDPLSPCNKDFMPKEVRAYCYVYLTPHLVEVAGGDMNSPNPAVFPKAFSYCKQLPESDRNRNVCISSFGKEFVGWARHSDGRNIATITDEEFERMISWCAMAGSDSYLCVQGIQGYLYWGGENDPRISVRFCTLLAFSEKHEDDRCFVNLSSLISRYIPDTQERGSICSLLPETVRESCMTQFIEKDGENGLH